MIVKTHARFKIWKNVSYFNVFQKKLVISGTHGQPRRTTVAVAHVTPSGTGPNATLGPRGIQYGPPGTTLVTSAGSIPAIAQVKTMTPEQEDALIQKCEDNIKRGQFNSTIKEIKPIVLAYRSRNQKFHRKDTIVSFWYINLQTLRVWSTTLQWNFSPPPIFFSDDVFASILKPYDFFSTQKLLRFQSYVIKAKKKNLTFITCRR